MKMATATENRQFVSIIDSEKIKKYQNLNNNNTVSASNALRRPRNDSINFPSGLFPCLPLSDETSCLDSLLNDCMWNSANPFSEGDLFALIDSFQPVENEDDVKTSNAAAEQASTNGASRHTEALTNAGESASVHVNTTTSPMPASPSPSSTCASDTASYALSILDELEPISPDESNLYAESLDEKQLRLIFAASSPAKRGASLLNDEMKPNVHVQQRTKGAFSANVSLKRSSGSGLPMATNASRMYDADECELKTVFRPAMSRERYAVKRPFNAAAENPLASKMRRTVAASAARLGCAMSNMTDCEVIIREDEYEAIEHVEVECEVDVEDAEAASDCGFSVARDCAVPRRLVYSRNMVNGRSAATAGPQSNVIQRTRPAGLQQSIIRNGANKLQRTTFSNLMNPNARSTLVNSQHPFNGRTARASSVNPQVGAFANRTAMPSGAFNRQSSFAGRTQQQQGVATYSQEGVAYANTNAYRLLGRQPKRSSLPTSALSSGTPSDVESNVSMSAPRRGSSSYCSQMERNRRREMNSALAGLRRLILEDDRSLLSKVYAENQINRRNTSMIMTLRAAHDAVLKLNDSARRMHEERLEQLRRRERLHKRMQLLQSACLPAAAAKSEWS